MSNDLEYIEVEHFEKEPIQGLFINFCGPCGPSIDVQVMWPAPFVYFVPAKDLKELQKRAPSLRPVPHPALDEEPVAPVAPPKKSGRIKRAKT